MNAARYCMGILIFAVLHSCATYPESNLYHYSESTYTNHLNATEKLRHSHLIVNGRGGIIMPGTVTYFKKISRLIGSWGRYLLFEKRWGMIFDKGEAIGLLTDNVNNVEIGISGCASCHIGKAAGFVIPGLGNKTVDMHQASSDWLRYYKLFLKISENNTQESFRYLAEQAMNTATTLSSDQFANTTQGLVPVKITDSWFYSRANADMDHVPLQQVKVPSIWGAATKAESGLFYNGSFNKTYYAGPALKHLSLGLTEADLESKLPEMVQLSLQFDSLLPPDYPFETDDGKAIQGKLYFDRSCAVCHGKYPENRISKPRYTPPKWYSHEIIKTDSERLHFNDQKFYQLVDNNPLPHVFSLKRRQPGYLAPRLEGIWSRFPYLHNGSIPTLYDLLRDENQRPRVFSMIKAGENKRFDRVRVGLTIPHKNSSRYSRLLSKAKMNSRYVYDTSRPGHSSKGHNFSSTLDHQQRMLLVEYLKTL